MYAYSRKHLLYVHYDALVKSHRQFGWAYKLTYKDLMVFQILVLVIDDDDDGDEVVELPEKNRKYIKKQIFSILFYQTGFCKNLCAK